jgi:hypothetical protein
MSINAWHTSRFAMRLSSRRVLQVGDVALGHRRDRLVQRIGVDGHDRQLAAGQELQDLLLGLALRGGGDDAHRAGVRPHRVEPGLQVLWPTGDRDRCRDHAGPHAAEQADEELQRWRGDQQHDVAGLDPSGGQG